MTTVEIVHRCEPEAAASKPTPADADAALLRLNEGNCAFADIVNRLRRDAGGTGQIGIPLDFAAVEGRAGGPRQRPFAAVVGCSDARVPVELLFNEGPNELFIVRVAGNGLGGDVIGSLKYAVEHLNESLRLIAVLGHSECGAVTAAVDVILNPAAYLELAAEHQLRGVLDRLLIVVHAAARKLRQTFGPDVTTRAGYRAALIEMSVLTNAALTAYAIQSEIEPAGKLQVAYGVYVLTTHRVWAPRPDARECEGLARSPADGPGFAALSDAIVQSTRLLSILDAA